MASPVPIRLWKFPFKMVLFGDTCVGKSCLMNRYVEGLFHEQYVATVGASLRTKMVPVDHDMEVALDVWDTPSHEIFESSMSLCGGEHAAIVVYDITNQRTFEKAKTWVKTLQEETRPNISIALAGNKADLVSGREVKYEDAQSYAVDNDLDLFMEVSAQTGENVENLFLTVLGCTLHMANVSRATPNVLHLGKRQLSTIAGTVTELTEVKILYLSHSNLTELPTRANKLTNLKMLILSHNKLTQLPESVVELIHLICLYVNNNQLASLPSSMKKLKNLQELDLRNNKLKRICIEDISDLKHLKKLSVEGNPLTLEVKRSLVELRAKNPGRINIDIAVAGTSQVSSSQGNPGTFDKALGGTLLASESSMGGSAIKEIGVGSVEGSEKDIKVESEEEIVVGSEKEIEIESEEENGAEEQTEVGAEDSETEDKRTIFKGTVTSEGTHWDLKQGAVHMTFPCHAVCEPTLIVVHRWKSKACSPQLQEHEAIVSNVIEISTDSQEALEFSVGVKLVLSHSAPNLHGYELVLFKLTDKERNEWEENAGTEDFRSLSDIEDEYPSAEDIPDFYFPVVQADITECSTYAVLCRLKSSPPYTITSNGGSFNLPDYPSVSVTIPENAVAPKTKISLQIKVQEVPGEEFDGKDILVGPILRICCAEVVEFLKPVTIQLPVSLGDKQHEIPDLSACRVRVLFLRSNGEQKEWVEITDDLKNPASFDGTIVTFQVERFSGYICLLDWCKTYFSLSGAIGYLSSLISTQPQLAVFFAYFPAEERPDSQDILYLICCPSCLRDLVVADIERRNIKTTSESDSAVKMIPGQDKAYASLSGGIRAVHEDNMDNFYLRFERDKRHLQQVPVRVMSDKGLSAVEFYSSTKHDEDHLLCRLYFTSLSPLKRDSKDLSPCTSTVVGTSQGSPAQENPGTSDTALRLFLAIKQGTPTDDELEELGEDLGEKWWIVGRRLHFSEGRLEGIDHKYQQLAEKGYQMLLRWKQRKGAAATYQVLNDALNHKRVQRQDLADKYCQFNYALP